jgi:uncharacterized protein
LAQLAQLVIAASQAALSAASLEPRLADWAGKLELLVIQPSPFCNLHCDYCYLPNRSDRRRMSLQTLETLARKVFEGRLPSQQLSVIWHAGEPLAVPRAWYEEAFATFSRLRPYGLELSHHFQTNAYLLDSQWCDFIRKHGVRVGVSIDGPDWLHDRRRRTRDGRGTHARVLEGVKALKDAGISYHAICVLTCESLAEPDAIFDFFAELRPTSVCFNIEEMDGANARSSLQEIPARQLDSTYRAFFERMLDRLGRTPDVFRVREVDAVLSVLRDPKYGRRSANSQNDPGRIITVGWDGSYMTFSPELLGMSHPRLGDLRLGNVMRDPLPPRANDARYRAQCDEISRGIDACREHCQYFDFCAGGAPANKLGESARFDATETMFCRLTQKLTTETVLNALDRDLQ